MGEIVKEDKTFKTDMAKEELTVHTMMYYAGNFIWSFKDTHQS